MADELEKSIETEAPADAVSLQLSDIILAAQVIELASSRGAFKADELTAIGGCYDRLFKFLKASGALTPPAAPAEEAPAENQGE